MKFVIYAPIIYNLQISQVTAQNCPVLRIGLELNSDLKLGLGLSKNCNY